MEQIKCPTRRDCIYDDKCCLMNASCLNPSHCTNCDHWLVKGLCPRCEDLDDDA